MNAVFLNEEGKLRVPVSPADVQKSFDSFYATCVEQFVALRASKYAVISRDLLELLLAR